MPLPTIELKIDWETWNKRLTQMQKFPAHVLVEAKNMTVYGVETLRRTTPRSKDDSHKHLADGWNYTIAGQNPVNIFIRNMSETRQWLLGILERGSPRHDITPKVKKWLKFVWLGRTCYAKLVDHPGTKAYGMIAQTRRLLKNKEKILKYTLEKFVKTWRNE